MNDEQVSRFSGARYYDRALASLLDNEVGDDVMGEATVGLVDAETGQEDFEFGEELAGIHDRIFAGSE